MKFLCQKLLILVVLALSLLPLLPALAANASTSLIPVPKGSFVPLFPISDNKQLKKPENVNVGNFAIQDLQVSNEDFLKFIESHKKWAKSQANPLFVSEIYLQHWTDDFTFSKTIINAPVTNISWFAANAYCESLGLRLPTTNEWEYVASFPLVVKDKTLSEAEKTRLILEWYGAPSDEAIQNNTTININSIGIKNLFGVVWEWTHDFNSVLMTTDNRANSDKKNGLFCGGGAIGSNSPEDYARFMRFAHRSSLNGRYNAANLGFRCAK